MQFVADGPDIPDALLQAHEEGRVVFFCGAGISYPAGLPGFQGLVEKIYQLSDTVLSKFERQAFEREQYDATLDLLERRLPGRRLVVGRALMKALKPNLRRKDATITQTALLRLAHSREGALRLVTTNFDRVFHAAAKRAGQTFQAYTAPMLPIPKKSRWNGLVYLHGLLPAKPDDTALSRLVLTSGDFGLAYLTERWAARFVSELFRNYVVCFVGYSINDPVLRYMMHALAADRMLGEITPQAWALGDCETGKERPTTIEWEAKGVKPILYNVPTGSGDHSALHQSLSAWADTYRDGVQGKEAIVVKHALARPQDSTPQDDFIGRMLWALSDKSGLPAKRFADFNPVPSLDWLLEAFGDARFSLIQRPAPYGFAPQMLLVTGGNASSGSDDVMSHLARWVARHLNDPRLVIWIAQRGGQLRGSWSRLVENKLKEFLSMERDGKSDELAAIRAQAPNAIPIPWMRTLWRLLLIKRVKSYDRDFDLYGWKERLNQEQLTVTLRLELRELLAPKVILKKPIRLGDEESSTVEPTHLRQLVDWELVLAADHVHYAVRNFGGEHWTSTLPDLLDDFQQLLRDALDLLRELGEADDRSDRSHWHMPSITPHWQNRGFHDWVTLIELLRDAWLALQSSNGDRAKRIVQTWFEVPYPTFKRLALFAASQDDSILPKQWVDWLLADGAWWLWSVHTGREVFRLFVLKGRQLSGTDQERLEAAILAGPPRDMYPDGLVADTVSLRLAKLNASGLILGACAASRLSELSTSGPGRQLDADERDEFSHWISGTGDPDDNIRRTVDIAPRKRRELAEWLRRPSPEWQQFHEDTWRDVCRSRFFHSLFALCDLAREGVWPAGRWREALQIWAEEGTVSRAWQYAAPLVETMPDAGLQEIVHAVTWWMEVASKSKIRREDILMGLSRRVLAMPLEVCTGIIRNDGRVDDPISDALNHPIGQVTRALLNVWFKRVPNDNKLLPDDIASFFTQLCDLQVDRFSHGRVLLAANVIALFRVDRSWTEQYLLPLFVWGKSLEAKVVWEGFLWSPRLYQPLLAAFKQPFLDVASHYAELGEHRKNFAAFLTYVALGPTEGYSVDELRSAFGALPQEGLERSALALAQALEGAADQRENYWEYRVRPFWQQIWPKSLDLATPSIATALAQLVIAARESFPAALADVQHWLQPIEHPSAVINLLHGSGLCSRFPSEALFLLNAVIVDQQWAPLDLGQCLNEIKEASSQLVNDPRHIRLRDYLRKRVT